MHDRPDVSLGSRRTPRGVVLLDHACGACWACSAGAGLWCLSPTTSGRDISPEVPEGRLVDVVGALASVAALRAAPASSVTLLLADPTAAVAVLAKAVAPGRFVAAADPAEARTALADVPTGRAAVVVAGRDARVAVRAVRRGGHVCVADPTAELPSVTELVQREVTLVGPRDVAGLASRIDGDLWTALAA